MSVRLSDFGTKPTARAIIRGKRFEIRALSSAEMVRVRTRLFMRPSPPPVRNPLKGGASEDIVLADWDADYRRELSQYLWKTAVVTAAIGLDFATEAGTVYERGMSDDALDKWAAAVLKELPGELDDDEIRTIEAATARAGEEAPANAEKN